MRLTQGVSTRHPASPALAILTTVSPPEQPLTPQNQRQTGQASLLVPASHQAPRAPRLGRELGHGVACIGAAAVSRPPARIPVSHGQI